MNIEKPYFLKRFAAYLIDLIAVTLLATAISLVFVDTNKSKNYTEELMSLTKKYTDKEITQEEFSKQTDELNYVIAKETVDVSIINVSVALVYYVVLCYFCHGITLGKYLMKLRIVSNNDKELNIGNYLLRSLLVNMVLSNLLSIILVLTLSKTSYISIYPKVSNVITVLLLATIIFIMYRQDGRGLHDIISNTLVISTKEPKIKEEVKEEIVEAKVIDEVKTTKKTIKKSTKKTGGKK